MKPSWTAAFWLVWFGDDIEKDSWKFDVKRASLNILSHTRAVAEYWQMATKKIALDNHESPLRLSKQEFNSFL